jgi:hypothetical protein
MFFLQKNAGDIAPKVSQMHCPLPLRNVENPGLGGMPTTPHLN